MRSSRKTKLLLIATVSLLVISFGFYPVSFYLTWSAKQDLAAAERQWAAHPVTHYRLIIEYAHIGSINCIQDVEVLNEQPIAIRENVCSPPVPAGSPYLNGLTVTRLFNRIGDYLNTVEGQCGSHGCPCSGPMRVMSVYDPALGYPRQMRVGLEQVERELDPDYWLNFDCTLFSFNGDSFTLRSFAQLP